MVSSIITTANFKFCGAQCITVCEKEQVISSVESFRKEEQEARKKEAKAKERRKSQKEVEEEEEEEDKQ